MHDSFFPSTSLRIHATYTYSELEQKNLQLKYFSSGGVSITDIQSRVMTMLSDDAGIKAVTVAFCDLEGKLQLLDYDKKYFLSAYENLTFDGSSIQGFTRQSESDLRFRVDFRSFRYLPADCFGAGKVICFAFVCFPDGTFYSGDFRARLHQLCEEYSHSSGYTFLAAPEIEGFLFEGMDCEQSFCEKTGFSLVTKGGYFNALPQDKLRVFIDSVAEVLRALGFENEKDHGEVAPSQFEINFKYTDVLTTCDQILLYKLTARQVAKHMGLTACFLPKPIPGLNGTGMHMNMSISKNSRNIFFDAQDQFKLSEVAYRYIYGILNYGNDLCLVLNSSVNAYRRLDPHFEAPNEIKFSDRDRGSMVRIPIGNERSARIEVRTVAPDAHPYLTLYTLISAGLAGISWSEEKVNEVKVLLSGKAKKLPGIISESLAYFGASEFMKSLMAVDQHSKFMELKAGVSDRSPRLLGNKLKRGEVVFHHEVRNQMLWSDF